MSNYKLNYKAIIIGIIIITISVILDRWSKEAIISFFDSRQQSNHLEITSFFNLVLVWNKGVSFGLMNGIKNGSSIFLAISIFISLILSFWLAISEKFVTYISLSLIVGGAIGNVVDRIKYQAVADFLEFHYQNYAFPAFNIADSLICIGVTLLFIENIIEEMNNKTTKREKNVKN